MGGLNNAMLIGQKDVQHELDYLTRNRNINNIRIFDDGGIIKYSTKKSEIGKNILSIASYVDGFNIDKKISLFPQKSIHSIEGPVLNKPNCNPCHGTSVIIAYIELETNLTTFESNFSEFYNSIPLYAAGIVLILIIGSYLLFNNLISKPLNIFNNAINELKTGHFNSQLPKNREDEIGVLYYHFNQMVNELRESREKIDELHFEQLLRANKLVVLGELTSEIAHEVNNHSAIVMARAENLIDALRENSAYKNYQKDLKVILGQIENISKITERILLHSKKKPSIFKEINLISAIEESLLILTPHLKNRNIKVIKKIERQNAKIIGDFTQIEQILINLINNSLDAIGENGIITITLDQHKDDKLKLTIEDNGKGIPKNDIEHIFSPFFTTKEDSKGTGLGLYIVYNICKQHNASITCNSVLNRGTSFTVIFNRAG